MFRFLSKREARREELAHSERTARILKNARLHARRLLHAPQSGNYRSLFSASGIEYSHSREYVFGDDIRHIDWNVSARMEKPYVKSFVEERDRTLWIACDVSPSMDMGAPRALRSLAAEISATLMLLAAANRDRAGGMTFCASVQDVFKTAKTASLSARFASSILDAGQQAKNNEAAARAAGSRASKENQSDLHGALLYAKRILPARSLVVIISDFFSDRLEESIQSMVQRHEVVLIRLMCDVRAMLPAAGSMAVADCEDGTQAVYSFKQMRDALTAAGSFAASFAGSFSGAAQAAGAHGAGYAGGSRYQDEQLEKAWASAERMRGVRTLTVMSSDSVLAALGALFKKSAAHRAGMDHPAASPTNPRAGGDGQSSNQRSNQTSNQRSRP